MRILARPAPSSALVFSIRGAADVAVGAGGTGVTVAGVGSPEVMVAGAVAISRLARNHPAAAATITTVTITISVQLMRNRRAGAAGFSGTSSGAGACVVSQAASNASASSPSSRAYLRKCPLAYTGAPRLSKRPASRASMVPTPTCKSSAICAALRPRRSLSAFNRCPGAAAAFDSFGLLGKLCPALIRLPFGSEQRPGLLGLRVFALQPARIGIGRRLVAARAFHAYPEPQDLRTRRCYHREVALDQAARFVIARLGAALEIQVRELQERIAEAWLDGQRLAKVFLGLIEALRATHAHAGIGDRNLGCAVDRVVRRLEQHLLAFVRLALAAQIHAVVVLHLGIVGLEAQCSRVMFIGLLVIAKAVIDQPRGHLHRNIVRILRQRPIDFLAGDRQVTFLQVLDGELRIEGGSFGW